MAITIPANTNTAITAIVQLHKRGTPDTLARRRRRISSPDHAYCRAVRRALAVSGVVLTAGTGTAIAAGAGTVSVKLSPNSVSRVSTLSVVAQGPFPGVSGLPTSVAVLVQ